MKLNAVIITAVIGLGVLDFTYFDDKRFIIFLNKIVQDDEIEMN